MTETREFVLKNSSTRREHKENVSPNNPYISSASSSAFNLNEQVGQMAAGAKVLLSLLAALSSLIYLSLYTMIPGFEQVFHEFGAEVPLFSLLFLKIRPVYLVIGILSLLPFLTWFNNPLAFKYRTAVKRFCIKNFVVSIFVYIAVMVSIYLPIKTLGEVIG